MSDAVGIVGLTVDAAEGQVGVQDIAAILKAWAQEFETPADWTEAE